MPDPHRPRLLFVVTVFVALLKAIYDYPLLPERMASHFGPAGFPNGWMAKPAFFAIYAASAGMAAAVGFLVPRTFAAKSGAGIRLPHKEYWLAPGRRAETFAYFQRHFGWFGLEVLLMEVLTIQLAIQANFRAPPRLAAGPVIGLVAAFVGFTVVWTMRMFRRFSSVPGAMPAGK